MSFGGCDSRLSHPFFCPAPDVAGQHFLYTADRIDKGIGQPAFS
jgi:hypothetical protein